MDQIAYRSWLVTSMAGALGALFWSAVDGSRAYAQPAQETRPAPVEDEKEWLKGVPGDVQRAARELFRAGNAHMDEQQYPEAVAKYEEALQLWPHPAFHYNLAVAQVNLAQPLIAYRHFVEACSQGPELLGAEKYEEGRNYIKLLESQLTELTIACEAPGAVVSLDGERLFVGPGEHTRMVSPGVRQLVVELPGGIPYTRQLALAPGKAFRHVVTPDVLVPVRRWSVWKPWAMTAVGGVILAGAGYVNARAFVDRGALEVDFAVQCRVGCMLLPEQLASELDGVSFRRRLSFVGFAVGGAVLVTSAYLIFLNREQLVRQPESPAAVKLVPLVADGGGIGIHALGHF